MSKQTDTQRRGQPLMVYALLIVGWVGIRSVFWDSPLPATMAAVLEEESVVEVAPPATAVLPMEEREVLENRDQQAVPPAMHHSDPWRSDGDWRIVEPMDGAVLQPVAFTQDGDDAAAAVEFSDTAAAAGHQLMWMAAMAHFPVPKALSADQDRQAAPAPNSWLPLAKARGQKRWSLDAWVFLREDSRDSVGQAGVRPSYGRSQQGAVLRYRLADAGGREPSLYARYTRALAGNRETDLAAGIVAKPIPAIPVQAHLELRASRTNGKTDWRPAAFLTTGLHEALPHGFLVRGYGQAGYVGGDFATAFVDGQLVADREVAKFDLGRLGEGKVNLGAGAWAGAQKGAERVDVGPSANVVVPVGDAPVRLSVDYRFRVAGDAEPDSGMALTLSTGF